MYDSRIKTSLTGFALTIALLCGCEQPSTPELVENGYPTQARVEYVLQCMQTNGGQTYDTLYPCVCTIDRIAAQMKYEDFAEAQTFTYMRSAPGEAGGLFRDPPRAKELRGQYKDAEKLAKQKCFIKNRADSTPEES